MIWNDAYAVDESGNKPKDAYDDGVDIEIMSQTTAHTAYLLVCIR